MNTLDQLAFNKGFLKVFCRGPRKIHGDRLRAINSKRIRVMEANDLTEMKALATELNALMGVAELPAENAGIGQWDLAVIKLMDLRVPCGEDISDLIGAPPYDGEMRSIDCPACGSEHKFRPAICDEVTAERDASFQQSLDKLSE